MSIFDKVGCHTTGMRAIDGIRPTEVDLKRAKTGNVRDYTADQNEEYVLRLTVSQNFWANPAQRSDVERYAMQELAAFLYQDVLREVPRILLAIESGDRRGAIEGCLRIKEVTQP